MVGTTLAAANKLGRRAYGFELKRDFVKAFYDKILPMYQPDLIDEFNLNEFQRKRRERIEQFKKNKLIENL